MLTVRWRPGVGRVQESVEPREVEHLGGGPGLVWLDLERPEPDDVAAAAGVSGVPLAALQELLSTRRPDLQQHGHTVLLQVPAAAADDGQLRLGSLVVVAGPEVMVTCDPDGGAVIGPVFDATLIRLVSAEDPAGDALVLLLDELIDAQWDLCDDIDDRLADAERVSIDDPEASHETLQALRRDILTFHRAIGPLRRVLADLVDVSGAARGQRSPVRSLRDLHDGVVMLREQIDTQLLLLNGLSQTQVLAASHRANDVMQATSSWGAILVVATLITGVYGMNFRAMPELAWPWGYPFALGLIAVSTTVLYRWFKRRGWL